MPRYNPYTLQMQLTRMFAEGQSFFATPESPRLAARAQRKSRRLRHSFPLLARARFSRRFSHRCRFVRLNDNPSIPGCFQEKPTVTLEGSIVPGVRGENLSLLLLALTFAFNNAITGS